MIHRNTPHDLTAKDEMIENGHHTTSPLGMTQPKSHRDPIRHIRLEVAPVAPSEMRRPSELLSFGPAAQISPAQAGLFGEEPLRFVIKRHRATRLHTDLRFEAFATLLSWASYDKPSADPRKPIRLREMGDHDVRYMWSERRILDETYGAGPMIVWDAGTYWPLYPGDLTHEEAVVAGLRLGRLDVWIEGERTKGGFRFKQDERGWTLRKLDDKHVAPAGEVFRDVSAVSGRTLDHIEHEYQTMLRKRHDR